MSFADPNLRRPAGSRSESTERTPTDTDVRSGRSVKREQALAAVERPRGSAFRRSIDWEHVGLLSAGLLIGAVVGAGAALLMAPQSGEETRTIIRRQARNARHRASDAWADLADELADVTRRGRRRARRVMRRARWRASDAIA
jgi:hypothetical protein